jgi:hypothetical protein
LLKKKKTISQTDGKQNKRPLYYVLEMKNIIDQYFPKEIINKVFQMEKKTLNLFFFVVQARSKKKYTIKPGNQSWEKKKSVYVFLDKVFLFVAR